MKTNELNNGIKEVYAKPALQMEEIEVQWEYLDSSATGTSSSGQNNGCAHETCLFGDCSDPSSDDGLVCEEWFLENYPSC